MYLEHRKVVSRWHGVWFEIFKEWWKVIETYSAE
jgi:hypothetical protein